MTSRSCATDSVDKILRYDNEKMKLSLRGEAEAISCIVERLPRTLRVLAMTVKKRRCRKNRSI
ncbi:MAG: hypothetical protein ACYC6P_10115 [Ignavibacteriaceae bacterium]